MTTAIAYLRTSTDDQHLGIEAQRNQIALFARREGITIRGEYVDKGFSGGLAPEERPGMWAAITEIDSGELFLIAKRDRLARDTMVDAIITRLIQKRGAKILAADGAGNGDGPEGELMRNIIAAFAAYERALISYRTSQAMRAKRDKGECVGNFPYGTMVENAIVVKNPAEWAVVEIIHAARAKGATYRRIADGLNQHNVKTRSGGIWYPQTARRVCLFWEDRKNQALLERINGDVQLQQAGGDAGGQSV